MRARAADPALQVIAERMQLQPGDAIDYLTGLPAPQYPDVIYIDPMFPESKKTALVKKDMRAFQQIIGADQDSEQLFAIALNTAKNRVVVKRPVKAQYLADKKPSFSLTGKAVRFDVYGL